MGEERWVSREVKALSLPEIGPRGVGRARLGRAGLSWARLGWA